MTALAGKVAVVTGAAGGLGVTVCDVLREEGADVIGVDVAGDDLLHLDISTDAGNRGMVDAVLARHGRLDVLVLNAGVQHVAPIQEFPEAEWDRIFDVMVKGSFLAMKHGWRALTERPGGRIVLTASTSSFVAEAYKSAYVAAKHAVLGLIRVAALEGGPLGLTANAVAPTWMRTPMVENQLAAQMELHGRSRDDVIESMVGRQPVKRFVETEEVARTIAFLASDAASGINGACVPIDLGTLVS